MEENIICFIGVCRQFISYHPVTNVFKFDASFFIKCLKLGMCLKENYSDSPSNEYSRHYSAESEFEFEYLRRQNMNSKLGEKQKNGPHVGRSPNFDSNSDPEQKKDRNDNGLIIGQVSINTRT